MSDHAAHIPDLRVAAVRRFNRFYTHMIGALREGLLEGPYSLTETRVLFELAHRDGATAAELARELGLDTGYLSRILARFDAERLLARTVSPEDARKSLLRLTETGQSVFAPLDARSAEMVGGMLARLPDALQGELVLAMRQIETALTSRREWQLRGLQPGDLGWVISRHGEIYAREFGWDGSFEVLVAEICAAMMANWDPARDAAWIAEMDGVRVGAVFLVRTDDPEVAKLRVLIVDPAARGLGIGARLVAECTCFARAAGYRRITLWTHSILTAARKLYAAEGYRLMATEPFEGFGQTLESEIWQLDLAVQK